MNDLTEVALAGFVHDWGKLYQRAEKPLSPQAERMEQMLCPTFQGRSSHRHVLWTSDVIETSFGWLPSGLDRARISRLASAHHRPSADEEHLITEADQLASGHDRRDPVAERKNFKAVPLSNVMDTIGLTSRAPHAPSCWKPQVIAAGQFAFPAAVSTLESLLREYQAVARELDLCLRSLQNVPLSRVCEVLIGISTRFMSTTPASTIDEPADVSLHDHSYLVAALSATLGRYHAETNSIDKSAIHNRQQIKFRFVVGELSGIQAQLFSLPTTSRKRIAKSYRARSFLFSMLTRAAARRLLDALDLPPFNVVVDAGGRFILLVPNLPSVSTTLDSIHGELDAWMIRRFAGRLTLNLDYSVTATGEDLMRERFTELLRRIGRTGDRAKRHRFRRWMQEGGNWRVAAQRLDYVHTRQREESDWEETAELGGCLPKARFVTLERSQSPGGLLRSGRELFGSYLQIWNQEPAGRVLEDTLDVFALDPQEADRSWIPYRPSANYVPVLNDRDVEDLKEAGTASHEYAADDEPCQTGRVATFQHLANLSRTWVRGQAGPTGRAALACMKADVDRLGLLFSHGLGSNVSFGRVASLSRRMDDFFKNWLFELVRAPASAYRHVYVVFSGGDDLLVVGPWKRIIAFADELRSAFTRLANGNPDITISVGVALGAAHAPMTAIAARAGILLGRAKNEGRNRIGIFGETLTWPDYAQAIEIGRRLEALALPDESGDRSCYSTAFLYRLLQYCRLRKRTECAPADHRPTQSLRLNDVDRALKWRSHLSYDLRRNVLSMKNATAELRSHLDWLESLLVLEHSATSARVLECATTYALNGIRGGQ